MKDYIIKELKDSWKAVKDTETLKIEYEVSKNDCETKEEAEAYFEKIIKGGDV